MSKIEVEGGELLLKNSRGMMAIIPKEKTEWVKGLLDDGKHGVLDKYIQTLATLKKPDTKAENGVTIDPPKDWESFKKFNESLPSNLRDDNFQYGDNTKYNLYGMWESSGKPSTFAQVKDTELFPMQSDGLYHGFSVGDDGVWLKPKNHPSAWMEYSASQLNPEMSHMRAIQREDGRLQYVPKTPFLDVVAGYKRSMESPTYKQRLARELYGDATPDMAVVEADLQKRKDILDKLVVTEKHEGGGQHEGEMGEYVQPQNDYEGKHRIIINPEQARKHSSETSVYAHEIGHAMDTNINDAFTNKKSPFTNKKTQILGSPEKDFANQYGSEYREMGREGKEALVAQIVNDVKSGKIKVKDKESFDYAVKNRYPGLLGTNIGIVGKVLANTNADENYKKALENSEPFKKLLEQENFERHETFQNYLMNDTEVKAKINALRMKAHLEHGYKFEDPFNIEKYPTLKGDPNYQQLNKELRIPDEAINKLSEYIAYNKDSDNSKAVAKNGLVIPAPIAKLNYQARMKAKGRLPKAADGMVIPPGEEPPTYTGKMLPEVVVQAKASPTNWMLQYALDRARPAAMSTGSDLEERALLSQAALEQQQLYNSIQEGDSDGKKSELFEARYGSSPHRWRYDTDPAYKKTTDNYAKEQSKIHGSIDLPETNVFSKKYSGNPNLAFMTHKGMSPEGKAAMEESNLAVIGSVLPVPGLQTVGKVPSVFSPLVKAAGKIANRGRVGATSSTSAKTLDEILQDFLNGMPLKPVNAYEANSPAGMTLEAFKKRIQSPEGIRRMQQLGITEDNLLQEIQLIKNRKSHGDYTASGNIINLDPFSPMPKTVVRHEIEHAVQNAVKNSAKKRAANYGSHYHPSMGPYGSPEHAKHTRSIMGITDIDKDLTNLKLRSIDDIPEGLSRTVRVSELGQPLPALVKQGQVNLEPLNFLANDREALNYFKTGSGGMERSAFLAEAQQHMLNTGIITDAYQTVRPMDVKAAYLLNDGKYADRKLIRLFNIIEPTEANFKIIADALNKMLTVTGATIGGGAALKQANKQNEQ